MKSSEPSSPERAYLYALRLLTARDYTAARLWEKLRGRGYVDQDVEAALGRMVSEGWVDDRRFNGFSFSSASDREKRRTIGFLQRRGLSLSAILRALRATEQ